MIEREPTLEEYQLERLRSRIRNILSMVPASSWTLEESETVMDALTHVFALRQNGRTVRS